MKNSKRTLMALALIAGMSVSVANSAFASTVNCESASSTCYEETNSVLFGLIKTTKKVPGQATSVEIDT